MPELYFTPASIGFLTQIILAFLISIYLYVIFQKGKNWNAQTILLVAFFISIALFVGLLFLDAAFLPAPRLYAVYLENTVLAIALTFLLQFAYRFPNQFASRKIESHLALGLSLVYLIHEAQIAFYRYSELLTHGVVNYRSPEDDWMLACVLLWIPIVFIRQSLSADSRPIFWPFKLWNPQGDGARRAREFTLIYILTFGLGYINILRTLSSVSTAFYNISLSIGILIAMWLFASRYIMVVPGGASVLAKVSVITLTLFLAMIGTVGWIITPEHVNAYHPILTDHQTLRFTPNSSGGYTVVPVDFYFETPTGEKLPALASDGSKNHKIEFTFPFYQKSHAEIYVVNTGIISMGEPVWQPNLQACCIQFPAIFPLMLNLDPTQGGGVFVRREAERLIITWDHLPATYNHQQVFTFQASLYRDGVFEISYNGLPNPLAFDPDAAPYANPWIRGVTPGLGESFDQASSSDLAQPVQSGPSGLRQNFYLDFRSYLDKFIRPLIWLTLGVSLLLILILPLLMRTVIIKPLNALLEGVRQMDSGNFSVGIVVHYQDDIGFLTQAFNKMAATLRELVTDLERRVADRTMELATTNERLRAELQSREETQVQILTQQRTLATLEERERLSRQLHDGLGQVMGYINIQTQATQALLSKGQNEAAANNLNRVTQLAQEAHTDIRNFILNLRASSSEPVVDFFTALETFTRDFSQDSGIQTRLSLPNGIPMPVMTLAVEEQILHIIREALANVRKHSGAKKAEVWFSLDDRLIQIIISDDGVGFDMQKLCHTERQHFGLDMMRERAEITGGHLEIRSAPGQGTKIMAFIPYFPAGTSRHSQTDLESIQGLRILLVDDSPIFLEGLRNLLMARGLIVVGMARDGLEAQDLARQLRPDVLVMDVAMPRCDGLEATRRIKIEFPEIKIVMLTVSEDDDHLYKAIQNGASGFLLKGMDANEFCTLLARLARGEAPLTPGVASRLISEFSRANPEARSARATGGTITERQWQILDLVACGLTYKEIAAALNITEKTVKYHMAQILERLHLKNRAQAIAYAHRLQDH
jgi:DNA-binding NarL/FixJ family response regulator/signal transduction histidine kinase